MMNAAKPTGGPDGTATPTLTLPARVPFTVTRQISPFGILTETNELQLVRELGGWKIDWHPGLIFKDLTDDSSVRFTPDVPPRGRIVDRRGRVLAEDGPVVSVGVIPGRIQGDNAVVKALSDTLKLSPEVIKKRYRGASPSGSCPSPTARKPSARR